MSLNLRKTVKDILCSLIGVEQRVLLWENPNTTIAFSATTINSSSVGGINPNITNLSEFDGIEIVSQRGAADATNPSLPSTCCRTTDKSYERNLWYSLSQSAQDFLRWRPFKGNDNSIVIESGQNIATYGSGPAAVNDSVSIPVKIYGLKVYGGGGLKLAYSRIKEFFSAAALCGRRIGGGVVC